jgi:predicted nucleic-acid-binding Zn-ribbon protein
MADQEAKPPHRPTSDLTPEQIEQAKDWLREHWTRADCPFHGATSWEVGDHLVSTMSYTPGGGITVGGKTYPLIVVTCSHCGYAVFVNAIVAGIVARDARPLDQADQADQPPTAAHPVGET